jgi:Domain of unknown function (DUF4126)
MDWFSTISLALGSAWTSGINLYATVTVLGLLQKFGVAKLPLGLTALDSWWVIGVAGFLFLVEFFADKIPYVDSVWDAIHTFIRIPAGAIMAYAATSNDLDPTISVLATLLGGGLALTSHGTKAALRATANLSPEPVSNWALSFIEDGIAIGGTVIAVVAPVLILIIIAVFLVFFVWFGSKVFRAIRNLFSATRSFIRGNGFRTAAGKAG